MSLPQKLVDSVGFWSGESKLHLPWLEETQRVQTSASALHLEMSKNNVYAVVNYTWTYQGQGQEGHIILTRGEPDTQATAGWLDSWHMSNPVMQLSGKSDKDNMVVLTGKYEAGAGPPWGWRIEIIVVDAVNLQLKMTNIHPDGKEDWAVEANYKKS